MKAAGTTAAQGNRIARTGAMSRRTLMAGALAGAASVPFLTGAASAAEGNGGDFDALRRMPYEVWRTTDTSRFGQKYEVIDVDIDGDMTRLFVPHGTVRLPEQKPQGVLWYYHSDAHDHTGLSTAFKWNAEIAMQDGAICVCPNYGGNTYVNDEAVRRQKRAVEYMGNVFPITVSFARANSGGAALMAFAYAYNLLPNQVGMYSASGMLNLIETATKEQYFGVDHGVLEAYNHDWDAIRATNPTYLPGSVWNGKRMRFVLSEQDQLTPPQYHGSRIIEKATGALEASGFWHDGGHRIPDEAHWDMIRRFRGWLFG